MKSLRNPKQKPTQTELARHLGIGRLSITELLLENAPCRRTSRSASDPLTITMPESWLRMKEALDLWQLEQDPRRYRQIEPIAA